MMMMHSMYESISSSPSIDNHQKPSKTTKKETEMRRVIVEKSLSQVLIIF